MNTIQGLTAEFVRGLTAVIEAQVFRDFAANLGVPTSRGPVGVTPASATRRRRKLPVQLCPVPRCKGVAAPVYGMVCAKHRDVPKAKIAKFREARRARKARAS